MNARQVRNTTDTAALMLISIVGLFCVGTMIALIVLAFTGATGGENVWAGMFSLMTAILGAVGGYMGGIQMQQRRQAVLPPPLPPDPPPPPR